MRVLTIAKARTSAKDVIEDQFGRYFHIPVELSAPSKEGLAIFADYGRSEGRESKFGSCRLQTVAVYPSGIRRAFDELNMAARSFQPDVVFAGGDTHLGWVGRRLARQLDVPFVFDVFDNYESFDSGRIPGMKRLFHSLTRTADLNVVVSPPLADLLADSTRVAVVPNGVDLNLFRPLRVDTPLGRDRPARVVYVGGLADDRGTSTLVDAVGLVRRNMPDVSLELIGPAQAGYEVPQRDWVEHLGFLPQDEVPARLGQADVAVLPYPDTDWARYTSPYKLREYLACEIPVVVTDVSTFRDEVAAPEAVAQPADPIDLSRAIEFQLRHRRIVKRRDSWSWAARANDLMAELAAIPS